MDKKRFLFIRHGKTLGNLERRYIGDPKEPLCSEGLQAAKALAQSGRLPHVSAIYTGEALRCRQTAEILFPNVKAELCHMREIDFGVFKGKNADDLVGEKDYEAWLETNCMGDIPGGDSVAAFKDQCCNEFERIAKAGGSGITAMVIHGGNIMSVLERFGLPRQDFYNYHVPNCGYFLCLYEQGALIIENKGGIDTEAKIYSKDRSELIPENVNVFRLRCCRSRSDAFIIRQRAHMLYPHAENVSACGYSLIQRQPVEQNAFFSSLPGVT